MSIKKVAERAGVSQATVSYVLNNKPGVSEQTARRVRQAIKELDYVPRASRRRDVTAPTVSRNIAVVFPEEAMSRSPLNMKLFEALHRQLEQRGARLLPVRLPADADLSSVVASRSLGMIDGMILMYYKSARSIPGGLPFPVVTVLGHPEAFEPLRCDHVEPDNHRIGALAARYLTERGHGELAVIKPSTVYHPAMDIRSTSFCSAAEALGVKAAALHIPIDLSLSGHPESLTGRHPLAAWVRRWKQRKKPPTGIFIPSDSHLAIVFNAMLRAGIEPGRDADFIGCNNESILLQSLSPTPATIDINPEQLARAAFHMLLQRIAEADQAPESHACVYVEPVLIHGNG